MQLPDFVTPEQLAQHLGWSPRKLRELARRLGACRILGNRMVLTEADVNVIMEATKLTPTETVTHQTGAPGVTGDYEALVKFRNAKKR